MPERGIALQQHLLGTRADDVFGAAFHQLPAGIGEASRCCLTLLEVDRIELRGLQCGGLGDAGGKLDAFLIHLAQLCSHDIAVLEEEQRRSRGLGGIDRWCSPNLQCRMALHRHRCHGSWSTPMHSTISSAFECAMQQSSGHLQCVHRLQRGIRRRLSLGSIIEREPRHAIQPHLQSFVHQRMPQGQPAIGESCHCACEHCAIQIPSPASTARSGWHDQHLGQRRAPRIQLHACRRAGIVTDQRVERHGCSTADQALAIGAGANGSFQVLALHGFYTGLCHIACANGGTVPVSHTEMFQGQVGAFVAD